MSRPAHDTPAGRAYRDLQNRARAEARGTQELLILYVVERWLARLSASPYADQFVLKGGTLLVAFDARRPTADALGRNFSNDEATVVARVDEIANQPAPEDGVDFRTENVTSRVIRDEDLYAGVRITMDCAIATALVKFRLGVNFGDPITPAPQLVDLPALRPDDPPVRVLGYPLETILAEKIITAIALGPVNTRFTPIAGSSSSSWTDSTRQLRRSARAGVSARTSASAGPCPATTSPPLSNATSWASGTTPLPRSRRASS